MTDDTFETTLGALNDLLDAERAAVIAGDLDQIARLSARKENLIDALAVLETLDHEALALVSGKVARNQVLLDRALEGIRSVARRLDALRRVRMSLETYDDRGAKRSIDIVHDTSVEKRA
ncbi:flagellar protein FlgN [Sulfitobacter sabulilitoris]|uniref:Flagellar protein FlgN n=1 Tax=Sulfitobacter sabulilitoris TaxID=2562655 RepID=A0A5S3PER4_9RHOB|nr:flagellar protein FlgN [Sulfitobacter sabulilitoris]TMM52517.1 flagellar protein FlgN [Sulfitobacter sabulilitoris]